MNSGSFFVSLYLHCVLSGSTTQACSFLRAVTDFFSKDTHVGFLHAKYCHLADLFPVIVDS